MYKIFILLLLPLFTFAKFQVTTYFPLETFIVKKIGQKEIRVKEVVKQFSSKFNKLSDSDILKLSSVKVYYHFGLDIEKKYEEVLKKENPELIIVDISQGIQKIDNNPYVWMDPIFLRTVLKNVYESLSKLDKFNKDFYKANYEMFLDELDETFLRIKDRLNNSSVFNLFVYDDYWFYFAKRFHLNLYKREKDYLNASQIKEVYELSLKKSIKKVLVHTENSYSLGQSLSSACTIPLIENDIFSELLLINQIELSQLISN